MKRFLDIFVWGGRMLGVLLAMLFLLGSENAMGRELRVTVIDEVTGQKSGDISLTAHSPRDLTLLGSAEFQPADTTFLFTRLPEREVLVMWPQEGSMMSASATPPAAELTIRAKIEKETALGEVVVQGLSRYMTKDGQVYMPTKSERKAAFSATSLLSIMAIPTVVVSASGEVTTNTGEAPAIFINYMPASADEVAGLRPMEIERVEVLDYPSDPCFRGEAHVINYVLVEYLYGGFTRLTAAQGVLIDYRFYSGYSKMKYRSMTYDVMVGESYSQTRHEGRSSLERYLLPGMTVEKSVEPAHLLYTGNNPNGSIKATYQGGKQTISNILGFSYRDSKQRDRNLTSYIPPVVDGTEEENLSTLRKKVVEWMGYYMFFLPRSFSLSLTPQVYYSANRSRSLTDGEDYSIRNNASEKIWHFYLDGRLGRQFGNNNLNLKFWGSHNDDAIDYTGTTVSHADMKTLTIGGELSGNVRFGKFWGQGNVGATWYRKETNGMVNNSPLRPNYNVALGYNLTRRINLYVTSSMRFLWPDISQRNPDLFLQTPLFAITGNPDLKDGRYNDVKLNYSHFLSSVFSVSAYAGYEHTANPIAEYYERGEFGGRDVVVRRYCNGDFLQTLRYGANLTGNFLSRTLSASVRVGGSYNDFHTQLSRRMHTLTYGASLSWLHGKWRFQAGYDSPQKQLTMTGWRRSPGYSFIGGGWGNGEWNFEAYLNNPFRYGWKGDRTRIDSPVYQADQTSYMFGYHCRLMLQASWSISYGKKIEKREDLGGPSEHGSGIIQ